jgi:membrane-associated protease RseP (regulator of RpoE activity)
LPAQAPSAGAPPASPARMASGTRAATGNTASSIGTERAKQQNGPLAANDPTANNELLMHGTDVYDPSAASASAQFRGQAADQPTAKPGEVSGVTPPDEQQQSQLAKLSRGLSAHQGGGIEVDDVQSGSVAGALGLQPGDVILVINGTRVDSPAEFARIYQEEGMPSQIVAQRDGRLFHDHP